MLRETRVGCERGERTAAETADRSCTTIERATASEEEVRETTNRAVT